MSDRPVLWHFEQMKRAGASPALAGELAEAGVPYWDAEPLLRAGCDPSSLRRLLLPFDVLDLEDLASELARPESTLAR